MPSFQGFDWSNELTWPRDTHGYVFFARAVSQIGEARHGGLWDGFTASSVPEPLSGDGEKTFEEVRRAHEALAQSGAHPQLEALAFSDLDALRRAKEYRQAREIKEARRRPKIAVPTQAASVRPSARDAELEKHDAQLAQHERATAYTLEHWAAASELIQARRTEPLERNDRIKAVQSEIEDAGLTGTLVFKLQHEHALAPLNEEPTLTPKGWNALHGDCFANCSVALPDERVKTKDGLPVWQRYWVVVTSESLERFLDEQGVKMHVGNRKLFKAELLELVKASPDNPTRNPDLLARAKQLGLSRDIFRDIKSEVLDEVPEARVAWSKGGPRSKD